MAKKDEGFLIDDMVQNTRKRLNWKTSRANKDKFRKTKEWKSFRGEMKAASHNEDAVTRRPLRAGWNLHHLDLNPEHYSDIGNPDHFACLNCQTHEFVHWIWRYWDKDPSIIDRLTELLQRMKDIGGQDV